MLRSVGGSGASVPAISADGSNAPITDGDRKDGIESLCKVFQIYGLPKNDSGANEAVHNAVELFKLAGNQSPERSTYILTSIVGDFRGGKLGQADPGQSVRHPGQLKSRPPAKSITIAAQREAESSSSRSGRRSMRSTIPAR